jgi:VWFA-related protein
MLLFAGRMCLTGILAGALLVGHAHAQAAAQDSQAAAAASAKPDSELHARDTSTTFKVKVNLVLVRAVVRDAKGVAIGNLHQEDFQLFDNGKPQGIQQFSVETAGGESTALPASSASPSTPAEATGGIQPLVAPVHFYAYLFDDVHVEFGDLVRVRDAASRHLAALPETDRAAIFTTSGQGNVDFTDDHAALQKALNNLKPRPVSRDTGTECPDITYYMAELIQNREDAQALNVATADTLACMYNNDTGRTAAAQAIAKSAAQQVLMTGEHESRLALSVLQDVIRHISIMRGQKTILLLSPGYLTIGMEWETNELIDRALRSQVVVSSLNARGLYTVDPIGDVSKPVPATPYLSMEKVQLESAGNLEQEDVMRDLASGTGGTYYHNSNDLDAGFRLIAGAPEYTYVLGFSPQNLKLDGRFHSIKVVVKNPPKLSVQARKGYYAPKHVADPNEQAKQEIEEALFSQEELHDLPIDLHTQFFKPSDDAAQLAVLVHIDPRHLHFDRVEDRNVNQLTIVSGLFDRNGKFVVANEKVLDMHLKDDTLAHKLDRGITLRSSFDVKPGDYLVRLVVRDTQGQISATNGAVKIP